jgi:hypothetical protein
MADDCCDSFGGRITIEAGNIVLKARGDITIYPTTVSVAAAAHQNGDAYYTQTPTLVGWDAAVSETCDGTSWDEALRRCKMNVTIVEEDNGRTHLFSGGRLVSEGLSVNLTSGEVSGLQYRGGKYRKTTS